MEARIDAANGTTGKAFLSLPPQRIFALRAAAGVFRITIKELGVAEEQGFGLAGADRVSAGDIARSPADRMRNDFGFEEKG
jgi:hypothetical protein